MITFIILLKNDSIIVIRYIQKGNNKMKSNLKIIVKTKLTEEQKDKKIKEIIELLQTKYYS